MNPHLIDPDRVAAAMLARGFAQLLAPEALDDAPAQAPPWPRKSRFASQAMLKAGQPIF